jgi:hypothetical protein
VIGPGVITAAIERLRSDARLSRAEKRAVMLLAGGSVHAPKKALVLPGTTRAERRQTKAQARRATRPLVEARAAGRCEAALADAGGVCRGRLIWDHFFGRGKVPPSVELEWLICAEHDRLKTASETPDGETSRAFWVRVFDRHSARYGYQDALDRCARALAIELAQHPETTR